MHYHVSEPAGSGSGVANKAGKGWLGYGCELIHNMGLGLDLHEIHMDKPVKIATAFVSELMLEGYTVYRVQSIRGGM